MEFCDVIRNGGRMCNTFVACSDCPMVKNNILQEGVKCWFYRSKGFEEKIEKVVSDFIKNNPEPVYPTWGEWLTDIGVIEHNTDKVTVNLSKQIPPDMASKLNIEPLSQGESIWTLDG